MLSLVFKGLSEIEEDTAKLKLDDTDEPIKEITKKEPAVVKVAPKVRFIFPSRTVN